MIKNIQIVIDSATWPAGTFPSQLASVGNSRATNFLAVLLHTAIWTRPPIVTGLHLSDYWAWLRYFPAISHADTNFKLCDEWQDLDPHQKTILSDDFGVGFTTEFLSDKFGITDFVDTLYFTKAIDPTVTPLKKAKKGPDKSPDFIGRMTTGQYVIVECKGTQNTRKALDSALDSGKEQKKNLAVHPLISQRIVAGLFIPQWESKEEACIKLIDPSWENFEKFFAKRSKDEVDAAITKVSIAKQLSLMGYDLLPKYFINSPKVSSTEVKRTLSQERKRSKSDTGNKNWIADRYYSLKDNKKVHLRFNGELSPEIAELIETEGEKTFDMLTERSKEMIPQTINTENSAKITTGLGFTFSITIDSV